jgi:hypothetical protein
MRFFLRWQTSAERRQAAHIMMSSGHHHRHGQQLPHAEQVEIEAEVGIRLAHELDHKAEQAVAQQEQAGHHAARGLQAPGQVEDDQQRHPFQRELIELGRMARQCARRREDDAPGHLGDPAPQLTVDKVADAARPQAERDQRGDKVGNA